MPSRSNWVYRQLTNLQSNEDSTGTDSKADNGHEGTHDQVRMQNLFL